MLDVALGEVVEHLVARDLAGPGDLERAFELALVEVADAPCPYLAVRAQLPERIDRVGERMIAGPVQQVAIDAIGAQPLQASFARADRTGAVQFSPVLVLVLALVVRAASGLPGDAVKSLFGQLSVALRDGD